ncbi:UDP-glucuronic acid decarboxylase family protein [Halovulum sp. GXIMD14794]
MAGRRVLITGGAGFIGSHITYKFLNAGHDVIVLDNLVTGFSENLDFSDMPGDLRFVEGDVIDPFQAEIDLVINLACAASPPRYRADPIHTLRTCVQGTLNAAMVADQNRARLVHSSTSEVYGDPEVHPQTEDYRGAVNPIGPRACYDEGKRAAETILFDMKRTRRTNIGVCRIFNTFGPRMDPYDGRVVSNFLRQALTGKSLTIYGSGEQTRSFCYVDDTVEGIWQLCHAPADVSGPINLGNPHEITVLELAERIREIVGSKINLVFRPAPQDDPRRRRPDISAAQKQLGWEPTVSLAEGLTRTLDYFQQIISSGRIASYQVANEKRAAGSTQFMA